jgi:DNA primase catalytic core
VTALAHEFFMRALKNAPSQVTSYVASRGLQDGIIKQFGIGFAPLGWRVLVDHLRKAGVSDADMIAAGLAARAPKGDLYDVFRGRLIIPVFIDPKRIAGFGGRVIPGLEPEEEGKRSAKYINSRETLIYKKSQVLFGLPLALTAMRQEKRAYMVEGYLDVISLHEVGVHGVVAACGTAITELHVKRLAGLAQEVIVLFDGDSAGRAAAGKAFEVFLNSGVDACALFLPDGEDPDSFARHYGLQTADRLRAMPKEPLFDCYIDYRTKEFGVDRVEQLGAAAKGKLAEALVGVLRRVESAVEREALKQRLSHRLLIEPSLVEMLLQGGKPNRTPAIADRVDRAARGDGGISEVDSGSSQASGQRNQRVSELSPVSKDLLRAVMVLKDEVGNDLLKLPEVTLLDHSAVAFVTQYMRCISSATSTESAKAGVRELLNAFGADWIELWKSAFAMAEEKTVNHRKVFFECVRALQVQALRSALIRNRERIGSCTPEEVAQFVQTNIQLERKLRELGGRLG